MLCHVLINSEGQEEKKPKYLNFQEYGFFKKKTQKNILALAVDSQLLCMASCLQRSL